MNSYEYIEEIKRIKGLDTDYKLCKALGWRQNKVTQYKNGTSMDNEAARQVAEILGIPLMKIIADMEVQRSRNEEHKSAWIKLSKMTHQMGSASPILLIPLGLMSALIGQLYILCKIAYESKIPLSTEICDVSR